MILEYSTITFTNLLFISIAKAYDKISDFESFMMRQLLIFHHPFASDYVIKATYTNKFYQYKDNY